MAHIDNDWNAEVEAGWFAGLARRRHLSAEEVLEMIEISPDAQAKMEADATAYQRRMIRQVAEKRRKTAEAFLRMMA